jgi:hypothetical protein
MSTATTGWAPASAANCTIGSPTPPVPNADDVEPAGKRCVAESPVVLSREGRPDGRDEGFFRIGKLRLRLGQRRRNRADRFTGLVHGCPPCSGHQSSSHRIWNAWLGEQTRSFMYIDDCLHGTMRIMAGDSDEPINLGSSRLVTVNQLVDIVERIAGLKLRRRYNLHAPTGVRGRNSDNSKIQRLLAWQPSITLEDGIERTYRWIYDRMSAADKVESRAALTAG